MLSDNIIGERLMLRDIVENDAEDVWEIWSNMEHIYLSREILLK